MLTQEQHLSNFTRVEKSISGGAVPAWIEDLRRRGVERFREVGFPSNKSEDWRHTNVAPIARVPFKPASSNERLGERDILPFSFREDSTCELVFVNGVFSP